jgi:hypothetical protein
VKNASCSSEPSHRLAAAGLPCRKISSPPPPPYLAYKMAGDAAAIAGHARERELYAARTLASVELRAELEPRAHTARTAGAPALRAAPKPTMSAPRHRSRLPDALAAAAAGTNARRHRKHQGRRLRCHGLRPPQTLSKAERGQQQGHRGPSASSPLPPPSKPSSVAAVCCPCSSVSLCSVLSLPISLCSNRRRRDPRGQDTVSL